MRSHERGARGEARTVGRTYRPGSRPARLAEASKQLAILLEDVDLDAEADLGEALTDAVAAVGRAAELAAPRAGEEPNARDRLVRSADEADERSPTAVAREEPRTESSGLQFVGEAGAE